VNLSRHDPEIAGANLSIRMLQEILEQLPQAVSVFDAELRLQCWNGKFPEVLGLPAGVAHFGARFEDLIRIQAEHGEYGPGNIDQQVHERCELALKFLPHTVERTQANGRTLLVQGTPLREDGRVVGFIITYTDITERKQVVEALSQAKEAAEAASRTKSRFLATMSHELRTPMNGILGMAQLLLLPELKEEERLEFARTILNSGQSLLTLLNDILDLSKVEAGKFELARAAFDANRVLEETQAVFNEPARQKDLQLECRWSGPTGRRYWGDPQRLRQMLSNLVNNAIKFTALGGIAIEASEISGGDGVAVLEFSVTDTGMGIAEGDQALLFKPFSQVDGSNTRSFGGTGLGLSIVGRLAALMGGAVGVESGLGKGSRFWFRIGCEIVGAEEESRQLPREPAAALSARGVAAATGKGVLVVEDNPVNRKVIEALLVKSGYVVVSVENGQEAVDAITGGMRPDLVLMDCQMPVLNGLEATLRIRQWEREGDRPRLPIIALTAGAFDEDREQSIAAGMDEFLTKPVNAQELATTLGRWLDPGQAKQ
jgi:signal transduction histidine kinase/ActR/RegA family two-component response regulator